MKKVFPYLTLYLLVCVIILSGCGDDDTASVDNEEVVITDVTLTFNDPDGGSLAATASDDNGLTLESVVAGDIPLNPNTVYILNITLENREDPNSIKDITADIEQEDDQNIFFFGWTGQIFTSPTGLGNIGAGNRSNNVNYQDQDENGQPVGLTTIWNTGDPPASGEFRIILKNQAGIKSATSSSEEGETVVDLTFSVSVE